MAQARVVSGMRPTGKLHLGHLVGALKNWAALQEQYDCFYFVADWHALTSEYAEHRRRSPPTRLDNVADWIAAGVDPERSTIFVQSLVPEHAELVPAAVRWWCRFRGSSACRPTRSSRSSSSEKDLSTLGFLGYPLLQTADVAHLRRAASCRSARIRSPHLELSREAVRRFHQFYGEVLVEPQPLLTPVPRLPGPRQPEDEQELRQHHRPHRRCRGGDEEGAADVHGSRSASAPTSPARSKAIRSSCTMTRSTPTPPRSRISRRATAPGKVGDVEVKTKLATAMNAHAGADARAAARGAGQARPASARSCIEGSRKARGDRAGDDGARARRGEAAILSRDPTEHPDFESVARRLQGQARDLRGAARSAAAPHSQERGEHLRHPDRAHHRAVPRATSS